MGSFSGGVDIFADDPCAALAALRKSVERQAAPD
jgi:hypothetical protein